MPSELRVASATPSGVVGLVLGAPARVAIFLVVSLLWAVPAARAVDLPFTTLTQPPKARRLAAEKKERVPKPAPPPETKKTKDSGPTVTDDDDDDGGGPCFVDCLFGFFGSNDSAAPVVDPASSAAMGAVPPPVFSGWRVGDLAIVPNDVVGSAIPVWSGPGGEAEGWEQLGELPAATRIRVLETHSLGSGDWLRVTNADGSGPAGWVAAHLVTLAPPGPPPPPPRWPEDRAPGARPRSMLLLNVGPSVLVGPQEVHEEYENPLFRVGLGGNWRVAPGLTVGVAAGYGGATGHPQFDYITSQEIDSPQSSTVHITDLGLRVGDFVPLGSGKTTWFWGLGPGGYWVYESAKIDYEVLQFPGPVVIDSGSRTESLSRIRLGGDVVTGLMWWLGNRGGRDYLGILVRGFAIAWSSEQEKSLTFDWIGDKTPVGVEIGLVYGHAAY